MLTNMNNTARNNDNLVNLEGASGYHCYINEQDRRLVLALAYETQGVDLSELPAMVEEFIVGTSVDKVSVRVPGHIAPLFIGHGYQIEASVPQYYEDGEPMLILAHQLTARRALASKFQLEEGYHLEFQYRTSELTHFNDTELKVEIVEAGQRDAALEIYLASNPAIRKELPPILASSSSVVTAQRQGVIEAVGVMLLENKGRVGRIQGIVTANTEDTVAQALINQQLILAAKQELTCVYSLTSSREEIFNKVFPAMGFAYRGKLGADIITEGGYGDRYVWSCSL